MSESTRFSKVCMDDNDDADTQTPSFGNEEYSDKDERNCTGCAIYMLFLTSFIAMVLVGGEASPDAFWSSFAVKGEVVAFTRIVNGQTQIMDWDDLGEVARFWDFLTEVLFDEMIVDQDYNGDPIPPTSRDFNKFGNHLILLGGFRLRQYRVKLDECKYLDETFNCYTKEEDKTSMVIPNYDTIKWSSRSENDETPYYRGALGSYPGSGFVVPLPGTNAEARKIVDDLKDALWIDGQTRMISTEFNLFNPTTGLHTVARIVFEFSQSGAVVPSKSIRTWRFMRYENNFAAVICDGVYALFVLFRILSELQEFCSFLRKGHCSTYWTFWNTMDVVCLVLNLAICGMTVYMTQFEVPSLDLVNRDKFVPLVYSLVTTPFSLLFNAFFI